MNPAELSRFFWIFLFLFFLILLVVLFSFFYLIRKIKALVYFNETNRHLVLQVSK